MSNWLTARVVVVGVDEVAQSANSIVTIQVSQAELPVTGKVVDIPIPGPPGIPGIVRVHHGSSPDALRPNAPVVFWIGSVLPSNAAPWDWLKEV